MADIVHRFPIRASARRVFEAMTAPKELDAWWTARSAGKPEPGAAYELWFGPSYDWRARVTRCDPGHGFEWTITEAMDDWTGTRVGFELTENDGVTMVDFYHAGWREASEHYRTSNTCWAMYLRILRRHVEFAEIVAYDDRLKA